MQSEHWRRRVRWSHTVEVKGQVFVWSWTGCTKEEIKDRHGCGIHAKSNRFYRVGPGSSEQTLVQQSCIFHGRSSLAYCTQIHQLFGQSGPNVKTLVPERSFQIYEASVYLLKWKCWSLFVSVLQWNKDALIEKHLFMISGTICDWTADGALDFGILMARLVLREPSFNPDGCGLWINLHTQPIFFHPLPAHIYTHQFHFAYVYWNPSQEGQNSLKQPGTLTCGHSCWFC